MKKILFAIPFILTLSLISLSFAGNVDTYGIGSKATALGGAYTAYADDPYAVYYNPAGLTQIRDKVISVGVHMIDCAVDVDNFRVSGTSDPEIMGPKSFSDESPSIIAPHLGFAMPLSDRWAVGVAAYAPWGLELEWSDDPSENPLAYNSHHSYYSRVAITPALAWRVSDKLSVGFGISLGRSEAGVENLLYLSPDIGGDPVLGPTVNKGTSSAVGSAVQPWLPEGSDMNTPGTAAVARAVMAGAGNTAYAAAIDGLLGVNPSATAADAAAAIGQVTQDSLNGVPSPDHRAGIEMEAVDDFNYSFNFGVMYRPVDSVTLGLAYRGRTHTDFDGDLKVNGVKVSGVTSTTDHPDQIQCGIRYVPSSYKALSLELDFTWTNWSIVENQSVFPKYAFHVEPVPGAPTAISEISYGRDWEDTRQIRMGVEWQVYDWLTLRGGFFYDPSPIPDDTWDIMWADADKKTYSLGCGLNFGRWSVDTVLQYTDIEMPRHIGGESDALNQEFSALGTQREVSLEADGDLWGVGITVSYKL